MFSPIDSRPPLGFQVYLADVQTLPSHSRFIPVVVLSLLDFEPIVFNLSRSLPALNSGVGLRPGRGARGGGGCGGDSGDVSGGGDARSGSDTVGEKAYRGEEEAQPRDHRFGGDIHEHEDDDDDADAVHADDDNGSRRVDGEHKANIGVARDDRGHSTSFFFNKGKSCVFTADPRGLSRALRRPGSLTLTVASKLTRKQVRVKT